MFQYIATLKHKTCLALFSYSPVLRNARESSDILTGDCIFYPNDLASLTKHTVQQILQTTGKLAQFLSILLYKMRHCIY